MKKEKNEFENIAFPMVKGVISEPLIDDLISLTPEESTEIMNEEFKTTFNLWSREINGGNKSIHNIKEDEKNR